MPPSRHSPSRAAQVGQQAPALCLQLQRLAARNPHFQRQLLACIEKIESEAARTPARDQELVYVALELGCNCIEDICDETGLQAWEVRRILVGFKMLGLVDEMTERRSGLGRCASRTLFFLRDAARPVFGGDSE